MLVVLGAFIISWFLSGWIFSFIRGKYSWIDFFWAFAFIPFLVILLVNGALASLDQGNTWGILVLASMYFMWSTRLSFTLFQRIRSHSEDARYLKMAQSLGDKMPLVMLGLYLFEGVLVFILSLPLIYMDSAGISPDSLALKTSFVIFALAITGEAVSDMQLERFKQLNSGGKKVCDTGFWRYSRHPNYFFELLIWFSYGVFGIGTGVEWIFFLPFAVMTLFICFLTGIPPSEARSLESRGDLYREYQKKTNILIPWFPKES